MQLEKEDLTRVRNKIVQVLLNMGADAKAQSEVYGNALHAASAGGHDKIVQLLLDTGADIESRSEKHRSALRSAVKFGHDKVV